MTDLFEKVYDCLDRAGLRTDQKVTDKMVDTVHEQLVKLVRDVRREAYNEGFSNKQRRLPQ